MEIMGKVVDVLNAILNLRESIEKDTIAKKPKIRLRFYTILIDYLNSPGSKAPNDFFGWYQKMLDERMMVSPKWIQFLYQKLKMKNEAGFRAFLMDCEKRSGSEANFVENIKAWIPDDEYRIISSTTSSNIQGVLEEAIRICREKIEMQEQINKAITYSIPTILIGLVFHAVFYSLLYESFITPGFEENKVWADMSDLEHNYMFYQWVIGNYIYLLATITAFCLYISWTIKHWHKKGRALRTDFFDLLPPYSLVKNNEQYSMLLIISSYLNSGKNFHESLKQAKKGASPYVCSHIDSVIESLEAANIAINIPYLGDFGSQIKERGAHINLGLAIKDLMPSIKEEKNRRFNRTIYMLTTFTVKPIVYLSLAYSIYPLFSTIFALIPKSSF
jgi:hypothetical protein